MTSPSPPLPRFYDAGEAALVVEFGTTVDPAINGWVLALDEKLSALPITGIRELVPTYRSLMVHYDPLILSRQALQVAILEIVSAFEKAERPISGKRWLLPCCYEQSFGEDVDEVAEVTRLSRNQVALVHSATEYRIYMYGFAPAYCYLGGLAKSLQIPRREKPRPPHATGAVMIGGGLASIASFAMPTGWYVLGRTPIKLYDPSRADPFLLRPGDSVRFKPVGPDEFMEFEGRIASGEINFGEIEDIEEKR
ncbi:5-oxoprolinase subunit B family protein [Rhizobium sp. AG207R]|uniref:5-oxoprolinase subunit B family protein n=1 Tax=Rhizobium sp. AG207R TaxID=2802287 RepID=UPI0022AC5B83|nr:allophanate hydrolase subunit 1 [Rhizobium sp. AG207R]MCZ3378417.1 allophanate hydrolase subunit 1 [Rhizobium sp. AG207R]